MRPLRVLIVLALVLVAIPGHASSGTPEFPVYTGPDFQALYTYAVANTLPNLYPVQRSYSITGNPQVDARIYELARARGYVSQPEGRNLSDLYRMEMQPDAAEAWTALNAEARRAGMGFIARSAYRSLITQRAMFRERLNGTSDAAIETALTWAAPPGMSKHHGGYAVDFRYPDGTYGTFRASPGYSWLAADNFLRAKRHGFLPSYPDDAVNQGPNPEPWEFVWVGTDLIKCGIPQEVAVAVRGPAAGLVADIEHCPGGPTEALPPEWLVPVP